MEIVSVLSNTYFCFGFIEIEEHVSVEARFSSSAHRSIVLAFLLDFMVFSFINFVDEVAIYLFFCA